MKQKKFDAKTQVDKSHYIGNLNKEAWMNKFYQVNDTLELKPEKVLVIGVGNGVVEYYLKNQGINVVTLDIDKDLNPDIVGSVTELNKYFKEKEFDVVICAHVLEHVPFKYFDQILGSLSRISKYTVMQLPPSVLQFRFNFAIQPFICNLNFNLNLPIFFWKKYKFNGQHYWQPYRKNHPMKEVKQKIKKSFHIMKNYQNPENHYSYHFILKSRNI